MQMRSALAGVIVIRLTVCASAAEQTLRPPAVPLVTHDPYFSIWSFADRLPDALDLVGRPAGYVTWSLRSADGRDHQGAQRGE